MQAYGERQRTLFDEKDQKKAASHKAPNKDKHKVKKAATNEPPAAVVAKPATKAVVETKPAVAPPVVKKSEAIVVKQHYNVSVQPAVLQW